MSIKIYASPLKSHWDIEVDDSAIVSNLMYYAFRTRIAGISRRVPYVIQRAKMSQSTAERWKSKYGSKVGT